MPKHYTEQDFEVHIEAYLLASGYMHCEPESYDRTLALIPSEVIAFLQTTQPDPYIRLATQLGGDTDAHILNRLSSELNKRGALDVLRNGIKTRGAHFRLYYSRPASTLNPDHWLLYKQNRFGVMRQLKYSTRNENSIDIGLFLNGVPIVTAELKNSLTGQMVENAIKQYRFDRNPKGEPLLAFKRCLVHFAVGNEKAFMTTRLAGSKTHFLPFNKGSENPVNPDGHKTAYLWEDIWQPDILLYLIGHYLHIEHKTERIYSPEKGDFVEETSETLIFPRYHQLDVVRKLLAAARMDGAGNNYLVQHSAGSGKSNSIAWLAHQLANLYQHADDTQRLFDSIIVVTDRRVLDAQLQNTIKQFEQQAGVVVPVEKTSAQLKEALEKGKAIIVTTLQKFPVISQTTADLPGQRFAVIIDEAHSSQSGESAKHLKQALSAQGIPTDGANGDEDDEQDEAVFDLEDAVVAEIQARGRQAHISYFAFTATPKNKTLELFGHKNSEGKFVAFHVYSMRQAIEERFILDVLENYTTFKRFFKLVKTLPDDEEVEKQKALRLLTSYVDLQPHAFATKTEIMLDHFLDVTVNAIRGRGRAMVVTRSRLHAVKFWLEFKKQMAERNLAFKPLVAFSGTVTDPDSGASYTETSCNQLQSRVSIPDAFKMPEYRILIVANKFQTGFDQPLLHTMYVDKRLAGVHAVQTLSRLNRTAWGAGKTETVVLDFVNDAEEIQRSFQPFYQTTLLEDETEPDKLYDMQRDLAAYEVYSDDDIEAFAAVFFNSAEAGEKLQPILDRVVAQWNYKQEEEREAFRSLLQGYIRLYGFVSQLIAFADSDLEKLYVFARHLNRKLPKRKVELPYHVRDAVDLDSFRIQQIFEGSIQLEREDGTVRGISAEVGLSHEDEKELLSAIVEALNEAYGTEFSPEDRVDLQQIHERMTADEELVAVLSADNTQAAMRNKFDAVLDAMLLEFVQTKLDLFKKVSEPSVKQELRQRWFAGMYRQVQSGNRPNASM